MSVDLKASIVRITRPGGGTAGTGFVVTDEGLIATCAHVVQAEDDRKHGSPRPEYVDVVIRSASDRRRANVANLYLPQSCDYMEAEFPVAPSATSQTSSAADSLSGAQPSTRELWRW